MDGGRCPLSLKTFFVHRCDYQSITCASWNTVSGVLSLGPLPVSGEFLARAGRASFSLPGSERRKRTFVGPVSELFRTVRGRRYQKVCSPVSHLMTVLTLRLFPDEALLWHRFPCPGRTQQERLSLSDSINRSLSSFSPKPASVSYSSAG